ncbi:MAG: formyltetrahydrofolate deformylase [Magnetovibrio sp.]|nr:formyltetrahydrofolate deformylase [Magnetovibrio sp.]
MNEIEVSPAMVASANEKFILTVTCPDTIGIVAATSTFFAENGAFISESVHYGDSETERFFLRTVFSKGADNWPGIVAIREGMQDIAKRFDMDWKIYNASEKPRVMVAVSRFGHCLNDLLHAWVTGRLPIEISAVVSNHDDFRKLVEMHDVPFHHLPVNKDNKREQEKQILILMGDTNSELLVLARYMQVLTEEMCEDLKGRCINIHHSFLPSFKGAKPYQQAHARGVKLIGATAHYVTSDLDEGPIIEQDAERVTHNHSTAELVEVGRHVETGVLNRAVRWHCERRVMLNGHKTIVMR